MLNGSGFVVGTCEKEGRSKCPNLSLCDICEQCPDHCKKTCGVSLSNKEYNELIESVEKGEVAR